MVKPKRVYNKSKYSRKKRNIRNKNVKKDLTTGMQTVRRYQRIGRSIGSVIGGPLSSMTGPIGEGIGSLIGEGISYFTGRGAYQVKKNSLLHLGNPDMPPVINRDRTGGVVIRRSEYVQDIITSPTIGAFKVDNFYLNPGLADSFQWLSQVAANFEEVEWQGLYYEYRSMSADALNSTNTALGQVCMAVDYNAANPNFANKQSMENYDSGVSIKPSKSVRFFVECAKNKTILSDLYIRAGAVPSGLDQRLYDLGNFQIATNGFQAASVNIGELWVCYQVSLRKPRLYTALGLSCGYYSANNQGYGNATPLGTGAWTELYSGANNLNITFPSSTKILFPDPSLPQSYYIQLYWIGANTVAAAFPTYTGSTGVTVAEQHHSPQGGATASIMMQHLYVTLAANSIAPTITVSTTGTLPNGTNNGYIYIEQVPNQIFGV